MTPISPTQLQIDFQALEHLFQKQSSATAEELRILAAPHSSAAHLVAMGWLTEQPLGRYLRVYVPAGALAEKLSEVGLRP